MEVNCPIAGSIAGRFSAGNNFQIKIGEIEVKGREQAEYADTRILDSGIHMC